MIEVTPEKGATMSIRQCPRCGYQLLPGETECPKCKGAGASIPSTPQGAPRTSGLAIAALVVGILGLCGGILAIPGLILAIVALVRINRSQGRLGGRGLAWSGIGVSLVAVLILPIWGAITFPVFMRAREAAKTVTCVSNAKQLTLGVIMYAQDHGERFPAADKWCDEILPHVKDQDVFRCPNVPGAKSGYAFNVALSGRALGEIADPARTVLIYESNLGWNGAGGPESVVSPPRHFMSSGKAIVIGFVDGHVRTVSSAELPQLVWQPAAAPALAP
jgi:hypothetical protein